MGLVRDWSKKVTVISGGTQYTLEGCMEWKKMGKFTELEPALEKAAIKGEEEVSKDLSFAQHLWMEMEGGSTVEITKSLVEDCTIEIAGIIAQGVAMQEQEVVGRKVMVTHREITETMVEDMVYVNGVPTRHHFQTPRKDRQKVAEREGSPSRSARKRQPGVQLSEMIGLLPDIGEAGEDDWAPDTLEDAGTGHIIDQVLGPRPNYEETGNEAEELRLNEVRYGQVHSKGEIHCISDVPELDMFYTQDPHNPGENRGPFYRKKGTTAIRLGMALNPIAMTPATPGGPGDPIHRRLEAEVDEKMMDAERKAEGLKDSRHAPEAPPPKQQGGNVEDKEEEDEDMEVQGEEEDVKIRMGLQKARATASTLNLYMASIDREGESKKGSRRRLIKTEETIWALGRSMDQEEEGIPNGWEELEAEDDLDVREHYREVEKRWRRLKDKFID